MRVVVGLLVFVPAIVAAQRSTRSEVGAARGTTRDSAGHRVGGVLVAPLGGGLSARTNEAGAYRLDGLAAGRVLLTARHFGFAPETIAVVVQAGGVVVGDFEMRPAVALLDTEHVAADPMRGKMGSFNRRRARGVGSFITRDQIEKRQAASVSELLRTLPGIGVIQMRAGDPQPVHMQRSRNTTARGDCSVRIYVDGEPYPNGNVDDFDPLTLEGVEVYRSASEIPADFRTSDATCGVIALWTRDPESARRKP
ncbi:MAG TPA: TonB-dependent receptor [Gemmatimonadaceae bacterium]|nr:TonB-dependent receptor [Gemmatimonadaceae bacterium]